MITLVNTIPEKHLRPLIEMCHVLITGGKLHTYIIPDLYPIDGSKVTKLNESKLDSLYGLVTIYDNSKYKRSGLTYNELCAQLVPVELVRSVFYTDAPMHKDTQLDITTVKSILSTLSKRDFELSFPNNTIRRR